MLPKYWGVRGLTKRKDRVFVPQLPASLADIRLSETQFLIWKEGTVHTFLDHLRCQVRRPT